MGIYFINLELPKGQVHVGIFATLFMLQGPYT